MNPGALRKLPCLLALLMLWPASSVWAQTNAYGLLLATYNSKRASINLKPTHSRLYVIGSTNQAKPPVLRLLIADRPFLSGGRDFLRCGTNEMGDIACEVSLGTNHFPCTEYAQLVDVSLDTQPGRDLLSVMIAQTNRVWLQIGSADNPKDFKAYLVPVAAVLELKRQARVVKGIE